MNWLNDTGIFRDQLRRRRVATLIGKSQVQVEAQRDSGTYRTASETSDTTCAMHRRR